MYKSYADFNKEKTECRKCDIGKVYNCVVCSSGNTTSPSLVVIGEAPGADELVEGKPFVGKAGKLLRKTLEKNNLNDSNTLITNTIPCRPENNQFPSDDKIVFKCRNMWLKEELRLLSPKYVLLVGGKALKYCLKMEGITKIRGNLMNKVLNGKPVTIMATLHPSYVLRKQYGEDGKEILSHFEEDIKTISKLIN